MASLDEVFCAGANSRFAVVVFRCLATGLVASCRGIFIFYLKKFKLIFVQLELDGECGVVVRPRVERA